MTRADVLAVQLGDPAAFAFGVVVVDEIGDDLRAQALERLAPAVFLRVKLGMAGNDPAEIAVPRRAQDIGGLCLVRAGLVVEQRFDGLHGTHQLHLLIGLEAAEHGGDVALRALFVRRECALAARGEREMALPRVAL